MGAFLKIAGDYSNWNVYRKAVVICDVTEMFIRRYGKPQSRTNDQMRQAARSCKQNIVEGISDSTVSVEMCLKLLGIARGSVRELAEDYRDFLRQEKLLIWPRDDSRTVSTRVYCLSHDNPSDFVEKCECRSAETIANIMLTLIHQIDSMLAKTLQKIERDFVVEGGIKEKMTQVRRAQRGF